MNMKFLVTTFLGTGILLAGADISRAYEPANDRLVRISDIRASESTQDSDPRMASQNFVSSINYARIAIATKNPQLAKQHIAKARDMLNILRNVTVEERRTARVQSGRVIYNTQARYKYHYFPIETGPVEIRQIKEGPVWAKEKGLAVKEAEIVYLELDLTDDDAEKRLAEADAAINAGNLNEADKQLAELIDEVVDVDDEIPLPADKARDNIALARQFIIAGNYNGARYALKHADDALDALQRDKNYSGRKSEITQMRKELKDLQASIARKDPSIMEKTSAKMEKWWNDIKTWAK